MTRTLKLDYDEIEREYIYDGSANPVSFTELAKRHNVARNTIAEKGIKGRWFERRKEFREQLGIKATEALGDEWVRFETAIRHKTTSVALKYLDAFEKALDEGKIEPNTRDMVQIANLLRTYAQDAASATMVGAGEEVRIIDPDSHQLDEATARRTLAALDAVAGSPAGSPEERAS